MKILKWINNNTWLTIILLFGGALRFYHIDFQSVWLDEIHTLNEANPNISLSEIYRIISIQEQMPPLYFFTVYFLFKIFGYTTIVARSYSAVIGIASLYAMYILGKELINKKVGLIATLLLSVNYFHLFYSQESRPYIFLLLFTILSFYRLILYLKTPNRKNAILSAVFAALMIHSHFFGLFVLVSQYFILLFFLLVTEKENQIKFFTNCLISGVITIVLFIPAIQILIKISEINTFWIQPPTLDVYSLIFKDFFGNSEMLLTLVGIVSIFYFLKISKEKDFPIRYSSIVENKSVFSFVILISWIVIVILIPLIRSYTSVPMIISRYFIVVLPAILLLIAIGINQFNNKIIRIAFLSLFVIFSLTDIIFIKKYYKTATKTQFREVSQFIVDNNSNNDPVVTSLAWYFNYFLNNEKVKTTIIGKPLQEYVNEMTQDSTKRKPFWYVDAHNRPYVVSEATQKYLDENFVVESNIDLNDTWTKHFVRILNTLETVDLSKFEPLKEENGAKIKFWIDSFEIINENLKAEGWAYIEGQDAINAGIKIVLISDKNVYEVQTQKIKRVDVTSASSNNFNLDNSGFLSKAKTAKLENGKYRLGIIIKDRKTNVEGLVLTDKSFDLNKLRND